LEVSQSETIDFLTDKKKKKGYSDEDTSVSKCPVKPQRWCSWINHQIIVLGIGNRCHIVYESSIPLLPQIASKGLREKWWIH